MNERRQVIHLSQESAAQIIGLAKQTLPFENGGILVGHREADDIVISGVLAVPPESAGARHYKRESEVADRILQDYLQGSDDLEGYVGEWHSHPALAGPSRLDMRTLREIASIAQGSVALIVCAFSKDRSRQVFHVRLADRNLEQANLVTIPELRISRPAQDARAPDQEVYP